MYQQSNQFYLCTQHNKQLFRTKGATCVCMCGHRNQHRKHVWLDWHKFSSAVWCTCFVVLHSPVQIDIHVVCNLTISSLTVITSVNMYKIYCGVVTSQSEIDLGMGWGWWASLHLPSSEMGFREVVNHGEWVAMTRILHYTIRFVVCVRETEISHKKTHLGNSPSAVKHFLYSTLAEWCATCFVPSHHLKLFKFHCHLSQQGENFNSKLLCSADDLFNCKTMFNPSTCVSSI